MNLDDVEHLREGWDFEAKAAAGRHGRGEIPASMWETYSAMANTSGGLILLGAKERKDRSLDVRGVVDIDKVETELWNVLENREKVSVNLLRQPDVQRIDVGGATALLLQIPMASRQDRPVYINNSWENGTYIRVHEGDRRLGSEAARRMVADAVKDRDAGIVEDYTLADLNGESVARYREFFRARRPDHPFLREDNAGFLVRVGAVRRSRRGDGALRPTWAGLYMLGEEASLREVLPYWRLSFKELPDDPGDTRRWLDRVHPDGTWNANVFEFYLRAIVKLHDGLKVPFQLEQGQYRKDETPVHQALREALVNTLVHADYQGTTGIRVTKRRSGFEFINPGLLLVSSEQLWHGGLSEPRNPTLHHLFSLLQLGEREGSGGPAMRAIWRAQSWRVPLVWEDMEHLETHLRLPLESLLPDSAVERLIEHFGGRFTSLDRLGRVILVTAEVEGSTNHARIRELSDEHSRDITLKFQELVRQGLLESSGNTRGVTYSIGAAPDFPLFDERVRAEVGDSSKRQTYNRSSDANVASSDANVASGQSALAAVRSSRRAPKALVEEAIVEACRDDFATVDEIANAVGRAASTVRIHFLPRLVRDGRLEMRFPDSPTHQDQAYRAVSRTPEGDE